MQRPQTLREWQDMFKRLYGERNASLSCSEVWLHLMEEAGEVAKDLRYEDFIKLREDLADVFAWLCAFANRYGVGLDEIVWNWYPNICPRCGKPKDCTCIVQWPRPAKNLKRLEDYRRQREKEAFSLEEWQQMFTRIYGNVNRIVSRSAIGFHLMEELGEVAREIRVGNREKCKEELADVFAFIMAMVMKMPEIGTLSDCVWEFYPGIRKEEIASVVSRQIFISYAREDQDFVLKLATDLRERGIRVWVDQWEISAGEDWDKAIDDALRRLPYFLIVLSPASIDSREVRGELRTALDLDKHIIPLIYQSCNIPRQLRTIQYIDFSDCDYNEALSALVKALKRAIEGSGGAKVKNEQRQGE